MYVVEIRGFTDKTLWVGNWGLGIGNSDRNFSYGSKAHFEKDVFRGVQRS